jgi:transposase-like protein
MEKLKYGPYSPSRLETATCGFQFFNTYIEPKPEARGEGLAQARGSAVHEVFENITASLRDKPEDVISEATLRKWTSEAINRHPAAYQEIAEVLDMAKKYIRLPPTMVLTENSQIELKLAIKFKRNEDGSVATYKDTIYGREIDRVEFVECDYNDPEAVARGRADVLTISDDTTTAFILDHKTQPNVEDADTFQMGFYAWVISRIYPFLEELQTILHFARYGKYSEAFVWSKEDLYEIENQFLARIEMIESRQEWVATPYKNCQYCPFVIYCPVLKDSIDIDEATGSFKVKNDNFKILGDTQKAVKAASIMTVMDEASNKFSKEIREHVKQSGIGIAIPGKVFEYRPEEKIDWDKINKSDEKRDEIYAIFEEFGINPKHFMGFSETFTKGVWLLQNEALVQRLAAAFPRKITTKFAGYKV